MSDSIFDKILRKEIPTEFIYEDEHVVAFRDVNPQAPTHVLVIPKKKQVGYKDLKDAPVEDVGHLFRGAAKVAAQLGLDENGYRIVVNQGDHGQQSVPYIHIHIMGGRQLQWPPG